MKLKLLSKTPDAKTKKALKKNYTTFILYLDPRMKNICKWASPGCKEGCLFTAGRGIMRPVMEARARKTRWYLENQVSFVLQIQDELDQIKKWSERTGEKFCVRLNGTSDLDFTDIIEANPSIQFYDYTKNLEMWHKADTMKNYSVTFSRSEVNHDKCNEVMMFGGNVAVVFQGELPEFWNGTPVVNGDETDLRFLDPENVVIGLKAKGKARKEVKGFVVRKELPMVQN